MPEVNKVTVAVPSYNQGEYLDSCLESIFSQDIRCEVFVLDGGSSDNSVEIIKKWEKYLAGWRSHPDAGQSAAINEGIGSGTGTYVCWLNSDDLFLPGMLSKLIAVMEANTEAPVAYGKVYNLVQETQTLKQVWVESFDVRRLATRNIISQPGTLIRRDAWCAVGGVSECLHMSMDYELWWKLYSNFGNFEFIDDFVAVNRDHSETKTSSKRKLHYQESIAVVKKFYGTVPLKWYVYQPYAVWFRSLVNLFRR